MNELQIELYKSLNSRSPHYGEFLFKQGDLVIPARLKATALEYALATTNPRDRVIREGIMQRLGLTTSEALFVFAETHVNKNSEEEALKDLSKRNQHMNSKYWIGKLHTAIRKSLITPYIQPIHDQNNNVIMLETLMRLVDEDGKIYSPKLFDDLAKKKGLFIQLQRQLIDKTFSYFEHHNVPFAINLNAEELLNEDRKSVV